MKPGICGKPHPYMKQKVPPYPKWPAPKRPPCPESMYRLTAPDFGVTLKPGIKSVSFRQYDEELQYRLITNDGTDQSLIWLTMARNVFHRELSQMPQNYISKLVFNRNHQTVVLIKDGIVLGGICFRPFMDSDFAEIAFCAVSSEQQIRGFGGHLMAHVKNYLQALGIHSILTYADNSAVGYFKRQGFSLAINFDPRVWHHSIKDYQGATLIHCRIDAMIDYLRFNEICDQQKFYTSGLLPDYEIMTVFNWPVRSILGIPINKQPKLNIRDQMLLIVHKTQQHSKAWPFKKPVSKSEAPNYSDFIHTPMDLSLLEKNVNDGKYLTLDNFESDLRLIFSNCIAYNNPDSVYCKSALELEAYVDTLFPMRRPHAR